MSVLKYVLLCMLYVHTTGTLTPPVTRPPLTRLSRYSSKFSSHHLSDTVDSSDKSVTGPDTVDSKNGIQYLTKLGGYVTMWYFFTVVYNVANKRTLEVLPLPATVSCAQLIIGLPLFLPFWAVKPPAMSSSQLKYFALMSSMHAFGILTSVMSLKSGSVSFTQIVKAAEPIFAAIFSSLLLSQSVSVPVALTFIPIVFGVALASMKEMSFTWVAFLTAMASNVFYQLRQVLFKRYMQSQQQTPDGSAQISTNDYPLSSSRVFQVLTVLAIAQLLPIALLTEGNKIIPAWRQVAAGGVKTLADKSMTFWNEETRSFLLNLVISGLSFFFYNEAGTRVLNMVHPVTHAVGNTVKRVIIIFAAVWLYGTPISMQSMIGSSIAILGTFLYSLAQQRAVASKAINR